MCESLCERSTPVSRKMQPFRLTTYHPCYPSGLLSIMERENPIPSRTWPYAATIVLIPAVTIISVVLLLVLRPEKDNAALVAQIFGFGVTITMATLAYLKSSDTREIVNSRMDEFKRTLQLASDAAVLTAHGVGMREGQQAANLRTDTLAAKKE